MPFLKNLSTFVTQMKKLLVIPLLLFYLICMSGVSVNSFYCCGRLSSVRISFEGAYGSLSSKTTKRDCCNNITHFYKVNAAQQPSIQNYHFKTPVLQIPASQIPGIDLLTSLLAQNAKGNVHILHSPPLLTTLPLFIRNDSFLI